MAKGSHSVTVIFEVSPKDHLYRVRINKELIKEIPPCDSLGESIEAFADYMSEEVNL